MANVPDMQMIPYLTAAEPRNFVEKGLQRHNDLLEQLAAQMDELLALVRDGKAGDAVLSEQLASLREAVRPRHGLCIDRCLLLLPGSRGSHQGARSALRRLEAARNGAATGTTQKPQLNSRVIVPKR